MLWTPLSVKNAKIIRFSQINVAGHPAQMFTSIRSCSAFEVTPLQGPSVRTCVDTEHSRFCSAGSLAALQTLLSAISSLCR